MKPPLNVILATFMLFSGRSFPTSGSHWAQLHLLVEASYCAVRSCRRDYDRGAVLKTPGCALTPAKELLICMRNAQHHLVMRPVNAG